jgi:hypothetical protein
MPRIVPPKKRKEERKNIKSLRPKCVHQLKRRKNGTGTEL